MKVKLTADDAQEVLHKMCILDDEPELQETYGLTQEQADELYRSIPHKGGEWEVPEWAIEAVRGEMDNHVDILGSASRAAMQGGDQCQGMRIAKQAKKFERIFG